MRNEDVTSDRIQLEFMTVANVAELLGVGLDKSYALFHRRDFPGIKLGRSYRVSRSALIQWLKKREGGEVRLE